MIKTDDGIVCRTRLAVFILKNKKLTTIYPKPKNFFSFMSLINHKAFVRQIGVGTFKIEGNRLIDQPLLKKQIIVKAFPLENDKTLLVGFHSLQVYDGKTLTNLSKKLLTFLKKHQVYSAAQINQNTFALGTESYGIVIINRQGDIIQHIHKGNGLQSNSIYNLYVDRQQNLWAGLSQGVSFIELNSPFSTLGGAVGLEGSTYYTYVHNNTLLTGTSQGIFYKPWLAYENPMSDSVLFKTIPGLVNQTWQFNTFKGELLAAFNPGILRLTGSNQRMQASIFKLSNGNAWTIIPLKQNPNLLIAGATRGLQLLEWKDNQWQVKHTIKGFAKNSRYVQTGKDGKIWVSVNQHGAYQLTLNATLDSVTNAKLYDQTKGFHSNTFNRLFKINGKNLFATENGIYVYNKTQDTMEREVKLNELIGDHKTIIYLRNDAQKNIWYVAQAVKDGIKDQYLEVGILQRQSNGSYQKTVIPFRKLRGSFIEKIAPHLNPIDRQNVLFATKEGIIHFDPSKPRIKQSFTVLLRQVTLTGAKDSVVFGGNFANAQGQMTTSPAKDYTYPVLDHVNNRFRFNVSSTFYADNHKNEFRYRLEGLDTEWSPWTKETYKEYTNLQEGKYVLNIQTRNLYLEESAVLSYRFTILPPWHRTVWAYMAYVVAGILLVVITIKLYTRRLRQQKDKLEKTVEERTAEIRHKNDEILSKNSELEQQKEEILAQANLMEMVNDDLTKKSQETEKAYQSVQLLNAIGQRITSSLNLDEILYTIYEQVNKLMDASVFGIGIYQPVQDLIEIRLAIEKGIRYKPYNRSMKDQNQLAVWCINNQSPIVTGNILKDYHQFTNDISLIATKEDGTKPEMPYSMIYLPLTIKQKVLGIISVQSFQENAYTDYHFNLLKNLSIYVAIAIENAQEYEQKTQTLQQLKSTQTQLVQAEKMASLGQLTAGIAHEINNPINFVSGNIASVEANLQDIMEVVKAYEQTYPENEKIKQLKQDLYYQEAVDEMATLVAGIKEGAHRTAEIVKGLRTFSRLDEDELKEADLHKNIDSTLRWLHSQYKDRIVIEKDYAPLPPIECYPGKLNQVLMNLLANAAQAIEGKGTIKIATTLEADDQVLISIADSGKGMDAATQQRIFEPFFTTKKVGEGTGLGLSIALGIVEAHRGTLEVESKVGVSTVFRLRLPLRQKKKV
jgi:signal transduction histidine kinase